MICALSKPSRRRAGVLLLMFAGVSLSLVFLEGSKQGWYLVHESPLFAAFVAISASRLWESGNIGARMAAVAQAAIVLLGVAILVHIAGNRNLQRQYQPAIAFLNDHAGPQDLVFARSEFYFGLKCRTILRDDERLGVLSGRRANYIVFDSDFEEQWASFQKSNPPVYHDAGQRLKLEYREVFRNVHYRILKRIMSSS
jgi:hypothetical protein